MKKNNSMKNVVALILLIFFVINIIIVSVPLIFARAESDIKIYLNGEEIKSDVEPFISNDRVLAPARMIFEALDYEVTWRAQSRKVIIEGAGKEFVFTIGSNIAYINDEKYELDVEAQIKSERTFIPLRFFSENINKKVEWSGEERVVYISDKVDLNKYIMLKDIEFDKDTITCVFNKKEAEYNTILLENPDRLVIDIKDCVNNTSSVEYEENKYYNNFRYAQFSNDPMVTRLVIELNKDYDYEIKTKNEFLYIYFTSSDNEKEDKDEEEDKQKDDKLKTVVLDAGHGGKDPGALGLEDEEIVLMEKDVNLDIALRVYNLLKKEELNVYITRKDDRFLELSEIVEFANSKEADLLVSIHNNASENPNTTGTMTMYAYDEPKENHKMSGKELADIIQKHMVKATKASDFGPVKNTALYVVRKANMPAVITESLFITNVKDRAKLMDEAYIEAIAKAIYKGIMEALEEL